MSFLADWQKRQRDLKREELDRKKNASSILRNYRGGEHAILDQKQLKDRKDAERDSKLNASKLLHSYRSGWDSAQSSERSLLDRRASFRSNVDGENDSKVVDTPAEDRMGSENMMMTKSESSSENESDGESYVVDTPTENLMDNEDISMTKSKSSSGSDNSKRSISERSILHFALQSFVSFSASQTVESDGESHVVDRTTENIMDNEDISMTKSKSSSGSDDSKRSISEKSISEKSILHFALQSFVSFSSSQNIEESTHNSDKEIDHKGDDVESGKKGILGIGKNIEGSSSSVYKNDDDLTFCPSEDENIGAAHHRSGGNQDSIEDVIKSGCSPTSEIAGGELDSENDESNKKIQWSSSYEETKECYHGKIRSTETSSCSERNVEKILISETPTVESSQHEQTKPLFLRDIMFKGDTLGSLPNSHYFIRDENFYDAKEELLDNENISDTSDSVYKRKVVRFAQDYELYDQMDHDDTITNRNDVLDIYHEAMESPYYERKDPYSAYSKADFYRRIYSDEIETMCDYDSENDDENNTDKEFIRNLMYVVGGNVISIAMSRIISAIRKASEDVRGSFTAAELLTEEPLHAFDLATDSTAATAFHTGSGATSTLNSTGSMATTSSANATANATANVANTAATLRTASSSVTAVSMSATSSTSATSVTGVASGTTTTSSISAASAASAASSVSMSAVSSSTTAGAAATGTAAASATATSSTAAAVTAQMAVSAAGTATASVSSAAVIVGATVATGSATAGTTATVTATTIAGLAAIAVTSTLGPSMECQRNDEYMRSVKISFTEDFWNSNDMEGLVSTSSRGWDQFGNSITEAYNSLSNCSEIFSREMSSCTYQSTNPRSDGTIDTYWRPSINCNGCPPEDPLFGFGVDSNPDPITRMLQDFDPLTGAPSPSIEPPSRADPTTIDGTNVTEFLINKTEFLQLIGAKSIEYIIDTASPTDPPSTQPSVQPSSIPSIRPVTPSIVSFGTELYIEDEVSIPDIKKAYTAATSEIIGSVKRDRYLLAEDTGVATNEIVNIKVQVQPISDCKVDTTCVAIDATVKFRYSDEAERAETTIGQSIENGKFGSILGDEGRFDVQDLSLLSISSGAFSESPSQKPSLSLHPSASSSTLPSTPPSLVPSISPSTFPSSFPLENPSNFPSTRPSLSPSSSPSNGPTLSPSTFPTSAPSLNPSKGPSTVPSSLPTRLPSFIPSVSPTWSPSSTPSVSPSGSPSDLPSLRPSSSPSISPTFSPSRQPSALPSGSPSDLPSLRPSTGPSVSPTSSPSSKPSAQPSVLPSSPPSNQPSSSPSVSPTSSPSSKPSAPPSVLPSSPPSTGPSGSPSVSPTWPPSSQPSALPSGFPSRAPSDQPSSSPSVTPTSSPSSKPSAPPSVLPSSPPSNRPSGSPSVSPTWPPSSQPSASPSSSPSRPPSTRPSSIPSVSPTFSPSSQPSVLPTVSPSGLPSSSPSFSPSTIPTSSPRPTCGLPTATMKPTIFYEPPFFYDPEEIENGEPCGSIDTILVDDPYMNLCKQRCVVGRPFSCYVGGIKEYTSPSDYEQRQFCGCLPNGILCDTSTPTDLGYCFDCCNGFSTVDDGFACGPNIPATPSPTVRPTGSPSCTPTLSPSSYPTPSSTPSGCEYREVVIDASTWDCPRAPGERCGILYPPTNINSGYYMLGCYESCCPDSPCDNYVPGPMEIYSNSDDDFASAQNHYCVCLPDGIPCTPSTNVPDGLASCPDCCGGFLPSGENFVCGGCSDPFLPPTPSPTIPTFSPSSQPSGMPSDSSLIPSTVPNSSPPLSEDCPPTYDFGSCEGFQSNLICGYEYTYVGCTWDDLSCSSTLECECNVFQDGNWACLLEARLSCLDQGIQRPEDLPSGECDPTEPLPVPPQPSEECPPNEPDFFTSCEGFKPNLSCPYDYQYTGCTWDTLSCSPIAGCTCNEFWSCFTSLRLACDNPPNGFPSGECDPTEPLPQPPPPSVECPRDPDSGGSCQGFQPNLRCPYNYQYTGCTWDTLSCFAILKCVCDRFQDGNWSCISFGRQSCQNQGLQRPEGFPTGECDPNEPLPLPPTPSPSNQLTMMPSSLSTPIPPTLVPCIQDGEFCGSDCLLCCFDYVEHKKEGGAESENFCECYPKDKSCGSLNACADCCNGSEFGNGGTFCT